MLGQMTVRITLDSRLQAARVGIQRNARTAMFVLGTRVEGRAREIAPRDTEALAEGLYTSMQGRTTYHDNAATAAELNPRARILPEDIPDDLFVVHIAASVHYGEVVEKGGPKHGAQPYLQPALDEMQGNCDDLFENLLEGL